MSSRKINWISWRECSKERTGINIRQLEMISYDDKGRLYPLDMSGQDKNLTAAFWVDFWIYSDEKYIDYKMAFNHNAYCFGWEKSTSHGWSEMTKKGWVQIDHSKVYAPARLSCKPAHKRYFSNAPWFTTADRDYFVAKMMDDNYV